MNAMSLLSSRSALLSTALLCALPLASCSSTKKNGSTDGQYASYNNDGHYNPYPAGSQPTYKYQQYNESPPPPAYSGSDEEPHHSKKKKSSSTTHKKGSSSSSSSTSGSGTKSKSKKKSSSGTSKSGTSKSGSSKSGTTHKSSSGSGTSYTVKSKDTLYGIAKRHHTTVSKIKSKNGLSSDNIHEGQKLKLP